MSVEDGESLSPAMATVWGVRAPAAKGPKPTMSLAGILEAAVGLADAEGLEAVSMGRVAKELGASAMSLYRHVGSKEELLDLMVDHALGPPEPGPPADAWRDGLSRSAWTLVRSMQAHPWSVRIPIGGPPTGPHTVAWLEGALQSLADTGLSEAEKASVAMMLSGYVRHHVMLMADVQALFLGTAASPDAAMRGYTQTMKRLAGEDGFPALHRLLDAGVFERADPPDEEFAFGLERLLDGVGALVAERAR